MFIGKTDTCYRQSIIFVLSIDDEIWKLSISHKRTTILTSIVVLQTSVEKFVYNFKFCFLICKIFVFVSAKWSSNEDLHVKSLSTNFREGPPVWTPRSGTSPNPDNKDFRPVNFDSNSLKKKQQQQQGKKEDSKVRSPHIRITDNIIQLRASRDILILIEAVDKYECFYTYV